MTWLNLDFFSKRTSYEINFHVSLSDKTSNSNVESFIHMKFEEGFDSKNTLWTTATRFLAHTLNKLF